MEEVDSLYPEAVKLVLKGKTASISKLQRDLRIGYNRAGHMIQAMENDGIVLPMNDKGVREVIKQPAKKKAAPKKKAAKKKATPKKPTQKSAKKKAAAPKKKSPVKKQRARSRALGPIPKYHIDHKEWDKEAVMEIICDETISSSKGLAYICKDNSDLPTVKTVFKWFAEEDKLGGEKPLCDMYVRAKDIQVDYMADEIIDIGDNQTAQPVLIDNMPLIIKGEIVKTVDSASVQHAKLRSDNRKWIASKLKPRKYGDKLELSGDPERPLSSMTDDDLKDQIALLTKKLTDGAE